MRALFGTSLDKAWAPAVLASVKASRAKFHLHGTLLKQRLCQEPTPPGGPALPVAGNHLTKRL